jgi:hypothetical protein
LHIAHLFLHEHILVVRLSLPCTDEVCWLAGFLWLKATLVDEGILFAAVDLGNSYLSVEAV